MNGNAAHGVPRLMALIGSGEMAPAMSKVHRALIRRLAGGQPRPVMIRAAIIDTPYGFQANAADLSLAALDYFGRRLGLDAAVASFRRDDDILARETALQRIRAAAFVFSGPGSPSYALRQWTGTEMAAALAEKLTMGGALVVASAAALTMGRLAVPVYEIYKVGSEPFWLPGLDILSTVGIAAAVIPHWNNAEGAGHDTRFCFLGEARLRELEDRLPEDVLILGIDEHTALVLDLEADVAAVHGRGGITVRQHGRELRHVSGDSFELAGLRRAASAAGSAPRPARPAGTSEDPAPEVHELARQVIDLERAASELERRSKLIEPLVEVLLDLRAEARAAGDYERADTIRKRLAAIGVEVTDTGDGRSRFELR